MRRTPSESAAFFAWHAGNADGRVDGEKRPRCGTPRGLLQSRWVVPYRANSSITPLLKNTIDWVSRSAKGEPRLAAYQGKVASLMAASPGGFGGLRGLVHVRAILSNIGVTVLPDQIVVSRAFEAFDDGGQMKDARQQDQIAGLGTNLAATLEKLNA
mgnify:CR=1 FL=1